MSKELVIIAGNCYPINSATGGIAMKCAEFARDDYNVRVICIQQDSKIIEGKMIDGKKIYTLSNWRLNLANYAQRKSKTTEGIKRVFYRTLFFVARAIGRFQATFFTIDNSWWYKKKAFSKLCELNNKVKIDVLISFNMPIEAHLAALDFKKKFPETKWISYWCDYLPTEEHCLNIFYNIERLKRIEKRIIDASDLSFSTEEVYDACSEYYDSKTMEKLHAIPYYMKNTVLLSNTNKERKGKVIRFIYMGALYRKLRNPNYMLKLFTTLDDKRIKLDLYISGDCQDIVEKYLKKFPEMISVYDQVSSLELVKRLKDADVLINIENSTEHTRPSKLFELFSYKKAIVNFGYNPSAGEPFNKYPLGLWINENDSLDYNANKLKALIDSIGDSIPAIKLQLLYAHNTEDYVKSMFLSQLK